MFNCLSSAQDEDLCPPIFNMFSATVIEVAIYIYSISQGFWVGVPNELTWTISINKPNYFLVLCKISQNVKGSCCSIVINKLGLTKRNHREWRWSVNYLKFKNKWKKDYLSFKLKNLLKTKRKSSSPVIWTSFPQILHYPSSVRSWHPSSEFEMDRLKTTQEHGSMHPI